jgi:hypothetical protein
MAPDPRKSLMRSLGEFFGHILHAARTDPGLPPAKQTVRHDVQEETRDTPQGKVTLRRTTIDEVEVHPHERKGPRIDADTHG